MSTHNLTIFKDETPEMALFYVEQAEIIYTAAIFMKSRMSLKSYIITWVKKSEGIYTVLRAKQQNK